jgi:hypothetical protein
MTGEFTITLSGDDGYVSVTLLIESLESTLRILRDLESNFPLEEKIRWKVVRAKMQSPLELTIAPQAAKPRDVKTAIKVVDAMASGIRAISAHASLPPYFGEDALDATSELVEKTKKSHSKLTIFVPNKEPITPSDSVVDNIRQIVAKARTLYEFGTIEGKLEAISTHEKDRFFIWETLTNCKVECISSPELFEQAKEYLRRRVAVSGRIRYQGQKPKLIYADSIWPLPTQNELPQPSDIGPVDITGGLSSEEYVRGLRNAK